MWKTPPQIVFAQTGPAVGIVRRYLILLDEESSSNKTVRDQAEREEVNNQSNTVHARAKADQVTKAV